MKVTESVGLGTVLLRDVQERVISPPLDKAYQERWGVRPRCARDISVVPARLNQRRRRRGMY